MHVGRYDPYKAPNRGGGGYRGGAHRGGGYRGGGPPRHGYGYGYRQSAAMREAQESQNYNWQQFQRDDEAFNRRHTFIPTNRTPPKPIKTIRFPETPAPSSSIQNKGAPAAGFNLCATWLAKNQSITRQKKIEPIIVDDKDDSVTEEKVTPAQNEDDDEIMVLEENIQSSGVKRIAAGGLYGRDGGLGRMVVSEDEEEEEDEIGEIVDEVGETEGEEEEEQGREKRAQSESDDSVIIVEPFVGCSSSSKYPKRARMTQMETKMVESRWSQNLPSSSSSATNSMSTSSQISTTAITNAISATFISPTVQRPLVPMEAYKHLDGFTKDCRFSRRDGARQWNKAKSISNVGESTSTPKSTITVCSYNVLCQKTAARTPHLYKHLTNLPQFLVWDHRWTGLQAEFLAFKADILGLQEVQSDHYVEHFEPFMKQHGYEGVYKQKFGSELKDDGCAIFYRPAKFERVAYKEVNYFMTPQAISNRENIAQILALRCKTTGEVILVANTHLLFNQERGDVKLAQLAILFRAITDMRASFGTDSYFQISIPPVILMGDFNMELNSLVYDFVVKGKVHVDNEPVRPMSGQSFRSGGKLCDATELLFQTTVGLGPMFGPSGGAPMPVLDGSIRHPFNFDSAYHFDIKDPKNGSRSVSTFHYQMGAPDFIFFSKECTRSNIQKLQVLERFTLPTSETLAKVTPWPNKYVPSDHLPLMVKFQLTKDVQ